MTRLAFAGLVLMVVAAIPLVALMGRTRFHKMVTGDVFVLFQTSPASLGPENLRARWESLPEPVRRHLRYAIADGAPALASVRLRHDGDFRMSLESEKWSPITGEQYFSVGQPGFVWNGRIHVAPMIWVEARDRLQAGRGSMLVKFDSTFPLVNAGGPEIDQAARLRWLGEALWFPYALVGESVRWEPIDNQSARATLIGDGMPASAIFTADSEGKFIRISAMRYMDSGKGEPVLTPWVGRCDKYREFKGFRIPTAMEAIWEPNGKELSYARFRLTEIEYNADRAW